MTHLYFENAGLRSVIFIRKVNNKVVQVMKCLRKSVVYEKYLRKEPPRENYPPTQQAEKVQAAATEVQALRRVIENTDDNAKKNLKAHEEPPTIMQEDQAKTLTGTGQQNRADDEEKVCYLNSDFYDIFVSFSRGYYKHKPLQVKQRRARVAPFCLTDMNDVVQIMTVLHGLAAFEIEAGFFDFDGIYAKKLCQMATSTLKTYFIYLGMYPWFLGWNFLSALKKVYIFA